MYRLRLSVCTALLAAATTLLAQSSSSSLSYVDSETGSGAGAVHPGLLAHKNKTVVAPFSRIALGAGISPMGVNLAIATNLNRYMNVRGTGNIFNYSVDDISTNGFDVGAKLNFATAGASVDFYPFPNHGWRLSPGMLFYNQNEVTANGIVTPGNSITLNDEDYYSAKADPSTGATPITVNAKLGLNAKKKAFTMTTGWGNMIPRKGGHFSFPFEIGAAFTGAPTLTMGLTGWACQDEQQTECAGLNSSAEIANDVQTNLTAQIAKWKSDLEPLKVYPILSFGMSYNFRIRSTH